MNISNKSNCPNINNQQVKIEEKFKENENKEIKIISNLNNNSKYNSDSDNKSDFDYDDLDSLRSNTYELNILSNPIFEKSKIPIKLNLSKYI